MTDGQYRLLVAYLNFWTPAYPNMDIEMAMKDIGISIPREDIISELFRCGWRFNEESGLLEDHTQDD